MPGVPVRSAPPPGTTEVAIEALFPADSPRLSGLDMAHVHLLAQAGAGLPPIRVHRQTMRVIDGMHRLRAAAVRGDSTIEVCYFDGDEASAFLLAVEANTTHGLPLTLADRQAAVARIMAVCPAMSDRAIAAAAGLSPKTVGAIRRRAPAEIAEPRARIGRDGRRRSVNPAEGRQAARRLLAVRPDASLREISRETGISPNTVRRVRAQMSEEPVTAEPAPVSLPVPAGGRPRRTVPIAGNRDLSAILGDLQRDPSLRLTEAGRSLLRRLVVHKIDEEDWRNFAACVPPHCAETISEVARRYSEGWRRLAVELADSARSAAV